MSYQTPSEVQSTGPQHILKGLNGLLHLTIGLGMECSAKSKLSPQSHLKALPEARNKLWPPIRDNDSGYTMPTNYLPKKQHRIIFSTISHLHQ